VTVALDNYNINKSNPQWFHYFLCGYRGLLEHIGVAGSIGFDLLLDGTIPRCAGLSSSSALVCCSALVTMHVYDKQISRVRIDVTAFQLVFAVFRF
jgi:N-acetylgalactosamine kinase